MIECQMEEKYGRKVWKEKDVGEGMEGKDGRSMPDIWERKMGGDKVSGVSDRKSAKSSKIDKIQSGKGNKRQHAYYYLQSVCLQLRLRLSILLCLCLYLQHPPQDLT
jgi:hypothetical protein